METETDWLGNTYKPGDKILYSQSYGASGSQIVLAEVVTINKNTVTAKVLKGSRSGDYHGSTHIDSRTGRRVGHSDLHIKKKAHYKHKTTGEEITSRELYARNPDYMRVPGVLPYKHNSHDYQYVPDQYWDYVVEGPYVKTFYIKDNITKLTTLN